MAQYLRIRCVVKTDRTSAHERIHSVGGAKPDGSHWIMTQDQVISYIQDGTYVFYIEKTGGLKTVADGERPDKLLSLPLCP